jgi:transcriptional regulator with XRE-family HTH domain
MLPPYQDPDRSRIGRIGVQLWQEDLWREIIRAYDAGRPDQPDLDRLPGLELPAPTRYAVTNRTLLNWFTGYNSQVAEADRVRPFNFLLTFQTKSRMEMAATEPDGLRSPAWNRNAPKPASRYSSDIAKDRPDVFDRSTGAPIPWEWLRSYRRALAAHHLHSETKFRGGEDNARGTLTRRHVKVWHAIPIGKEADNLEEREFFGEGDESVEWDLVREDRKRLLADIEELLATHKISDRTLLDHAHVSRRTLAALRNGGRVMSQSLLNLAKAAEELSRERTSRATSNEYWHRHALRLRDEVGGRNQLARLLGVSAPYLGRILNREKPMTAEMVQRLMEKTPKAK